MSHEGPERCPSAEEPFATTGSAIGWRQQRIADIVPEQPVQLAQRGPPNTIGFGLEALLGGTGRTAEEPSRHVRKKRCGCLHVYSIYTVHQKATLSGESVNLNRILGKHAQLYRQLGRQLHNLPLLAQGNVFAIDPPKNAPRASTHYKWTRKVKAKTVTEALSREQYEALCAAIAAATLHDTTASPGQGSASAVFPDAREASAR